MKRSSWHYKLIWDYSPFTPARSICLYVWQVVLWALLPIALIPSLATGLVMAPLVAIYGDVMKEWVASQIAIFEMWLVVSTIIGALAWVIIFVLVFGGLCLGIGEFVVEPVMDKFKERSHEAADKEPGLFRLWLKAKKDKVCPIIEWED